MNAVWLTASILAFVTAERLTELLLARRNTRRLLAAGGWEAGAEHYNLIVGLHGAFLAGLWALAWGMPVASWWSLGIFLVLQGMRAWVLLTLGRRWTTRIIVMPGEALVKRGPYRLVRHPNYLVVIAEIAVLPLVFGLLWYAVAFSLANAALLRVRIRAEDRALAEAAARSG